MKKLLFLLIVICFCVNAVSQNGFYATKSNFISLTEVQEKRLYIDSNNNVVIKSHDNISQENKYLNSNKEFKYVANVCTNQDGDSLIVLPQIIIKFKNPDFARIIISSFSKELRLDTIVSRNIYKFECDVNNDNEVLAICQKLSRYYDYFDWCSPNLMAQIKFHNVLYPNQYYLHKANSSDYDINVEEAWQITMGNENVVVAVIDTGVDLTHEDLQDCVINGYTIGYPNGYGSVIPDLTSNTEYMKEHGTCCAGIIGADDNSIGIKGVASGVRVLPINTAPSVYMYQYANIDSIANAIRWSYQKSDVLSCSWGTAYNPILEEAFNEALTIGRNGFGSVVVCSSGNDGNNIVAGFPANINGVITVGAVHKDGSIWSYSQGGTCMDLVAPSGAAVGNGDVYTTDLMGSNIYTNHVNYTAYFGGTSAACPQVAGVVALMLSVNPTLTVSQVRNILHETAVDLGTAGFDTNYGYGLVDAGAAVAAARDSLQVATGSTIWFDKYNKTLVEAHWVNNNSIQLPSNYEVHWRCSSGWTMETDSVSASCRITRPTTNYAPSGYLYADVYWNGVKVATASRNLARDPLATYHQDACTFHGVSHPAISYRTVSMPYSSVFVHQGCTVTMHASMFKDTDVSTLGVSPDYWHHNPSTGYVYFRLPLGSGGIPFGVIVGDSASTPSYSVTFFTVSNNGNVLSINPISSTAYEVRLNSFEDEALTSTVPAAELESLRNIRPEWTLEVYDSNQVRQRRVYRVNDYSTTLDVTGWTPGTYVLRAVVGDEVYSEKLLVK